MTPIARPTASLGFTLLELMTTIAVAGILLAIAIPSFQTMTYNSRLTAQVNDMVSAMNIARSEAIKRNGTISFCRAADATTTDCVTDAGNWTNWIVRTSGGTVIRRGSVDTYGSTVKVTSDLDADTISFASDGLARTAGVLVSDNKITVCSSKLNTNNTKTLDVSAGSRISITASTGTC